MKTHFDGKDGIRNEKKLIAMAMTVTLGFTGLVPAITVNASGNIEDTGIVSESTVFAATDTDAGKDDKTGQS